MNGIIHMKQSMGEKELLNWERTRPITLAEKIKIHTAAIARIEACAFPGKAESLAAHRAELAILLEEQKAQEIVSDNKEAIKQVRHGLTLISYYESGYPGDLKDARLAAIIAQAKQKGTLA